MNEKEIRQDIKDLSKFVTKQFLKTENTLGSIETHLSQLNSFNSRCEKNAVSLSKRTNDNEKSLVAIKSGFDTCSESHKDIATNKEKKITKKITIIAVTTSIVIGSFLIADKVISWING